MDNDDFINLDEMDEAFKMAMANYPEHFEAITAAKIAITQEEMGIA